MGAVRKRLGRFRRHVVTEAAVRFGLFRRLKPVSSAFGMPRGKPIDRHYVEHFVASHRADIRGTVLEAGGFVCYARRYGDDRVRGLDIMYPKPGFPDGTLVADLVTGEGLAAERYDCLLLTHVFQCIYDVRAAVETCARILKPGGVLLATVSGIAQIPLYDKREWGAYWRFTDDSVARLFGDAFGEANVSVQTYGNVLVACAFMQCLAADDLTERELDHHDPEYQLTIAVRAVRAA